MNERKVGVIGCGFVGSTVAFELMQNDLFDEIVLIDANKEKAIGEALDIAHGAPFVKPMKIYAGDYDDLADAGMIIITAGVAQKKDGNETRLQLVQRNVNVFKMIIPEITKRNFQGILLVVSNPVDILTMVTLKLSGYEPHRVIGSGTVLDTARLKYHVGEHLNIDPRSVHVYIVGEHGDSEIATWSIATVAGLPLNDFCELRGHFEHKQAEDKIQEMVRRSGYEILTRKNATYYGVAMAVNRICKAIFSNERAILPVSSMLHGEYGLNDVCLSVPSIVTSKGVEEKIVLKLSQEEIQNLHKSANTLKDVFNGIEW